MLSQISRRLLKPWWSELTITIRKLSVAWILTSKGHFVKCLSPRMSVTRMLPKGCVPKSVVVPREFDLDAGTNQTLKQLWRMLGNPERS
jgi:hypothetical protein